ncbi:MAG: hypothetical protein Q9174_004212 [Haloplaca sp. 1 TL-2023]
MTQYLPLRAFEEVTNALNFDTPDAHIVGGCDLYTTKAAGCDKKLYKAIDEGLEKQYKVNKEISETLAKSHNNGHHGHSIDLSRSSPFGPLSQISARRTFAYLIATLNASHPDYDFSYLLRPSDFRREKSVRHAMNALDTTLYSLRPRSSSASFAIPTYWTSIASSAPAVVSSNGESWNPSKWRAIDQEMKLKECSVYAYVPEEDPYDGDEGAIWSFNYFFFNKTKKRVCYIYLKSLSIISHSPTLKTPVKPKRNADLGWAGSEPASIKRAKFWLGDRDDVSSGWNDDDDDDDDDEGDYHYGDHNEDTGDHTPEDASLKRNKPKPPNGSKPLEMVSPSLTARRAPNARPRSRSKNKVRHMSEEIAESIDV